MKPLILDHRRQRPCIFHWVGQSGGDKEALERCPIRIIKQSEAFMVIFKRDAPPPSFP
ncbi:hypothetical protein NC653_006378 [Populus alba x Populus x berolinensis]|uniref:Uncharacterized protein n=1 Tax=Populus alba x Populus x berolinensis TaxID=444605 RepID=A0AAD6RFL0_9ROSI|nr:hypothetical protein NC653_006378 [Populus alba x Populus x berolinensis]